MTCGLRKMLSFTIKVSFLLRDFFFQVPFKLKATKYCCCFFLSPFTSAADDGGHKERQVAVVQLQGVKLGGKLELGLHHVAEGPPQALEELARDEARTVRHQQAVLVHARGQHGEEGLVDAVLQQSHLIVEVQAREARHRLGEFRQLGHRFHRGALAAVEEAHFGLAVHQDPRRAHHLGRHGLLRQLQRVHVVDDQRLPPPKEHKHTSAIASG